MSAGDDANVIREALRHFLRELRGEESDLSLRDLEDLAVDAQDGLDALVADLAAKTEALEVYADARHWGIERETFSYPRCVWIGPGAEERPVPDGPRVARAALESRLARTEEEALAERIEAALRDVDPHATDTPNLNAWPQPSVQRECARWLARAALATEALKEIANLFDDDDAGWRAKEIARAALRSGEGNETT